MHDFFLFILALVAELISNAVTYWILGELLPSILSGEGTESLDFSCSSCSLFLFSLQTHSKPPLLFLS